MIQLSKKSRKVLRAIYSGLGAAAVSFSFPACDSTTDPVYPSRNPRAPEFRPMYGVPPAYREDILIQGQIKSKKNG